jgi:CDP-glucose 4,6-dehydratase
MDLLTSYHGRRVFLTGHTGFKGSWLALWLRALGADVTGYALAPPTVPSLFEEASVGEGLAHVEADILDAARLGRELARAEPDIVFHLAAQAIVRAGYEDPLRTLNTNVTGTANVLEAVRAYAKPGRPCAVVVVTSDKCYENREWVHAYRETDRLGGGEPYSMSKAAAELVVTAWREAFFPIGRAALHGVRVATVRAGNVIGGGDWAKDRIVPDCMAALAGGLPIQVRNPEAVRPWQHVLDPLSGYLRVGAGLMDADDARADGCGEAWNFGPRADGTWTVGRLVEELIRLRGSGRWEDCSDPAAPHEAGLLTLTSDKAFFRLGWSPTWALPRALRETVEWYQAWGARTGRMREFTEAQIARFEADAASAATDRSPATAAGMERG